MNLANGLMLLGLAALPLSAHALDDATDGPGKVAATKSDAAALVKQLGDQDYKTRKAAYRALEKMGAEARAELQKAAQSDDPEVRWSASLLLDRLAEGANQATKDLFHDAPGAVQAVPSQPGGRMDESLHDAIEEMHDSIRRMFGAQFFDGRHGQLELGPGSSFSRSFDNNGQRESTSIRVDQDGRVKVEQEKNGEKTSIEAESIEALRKEHPELLDGLGDMGGQGRMAFRFGPLGTPRSAVAPPAPGTPAPLAPQLRAPRQKNAPKGGLEQPRATAKDAPDAAAPRGELAPSNRPRLGVQVAPVKSDVAEYLELDAGVGLEVVRVVDGSAAAKLGIQARDIITEVNGKTIKSVDDVAKALGGKDPADAEVTVIRRGAEKTLDPRSE